MRLTLKAIVASAALAAALGALVRPSAPQPRLAIQPWDRVGGVAVEVERARDRRTAYVVDPPGTLVLAGRVPARGRLRFAESVTPGGTAAHVVVATSSREPAEAVSAGDVATGERWTEREIDLARFAGRDVTIEMSVTGGAAHVAFANPELVGARDGPAPPNVILYVVDCLRADHVGAFGYPRPTTPNIDRLAADGIVATGLHACASWTKPAVGCLFTSLYPVAHGAQTVDDVLDATKPTVAEAFRAAGYATAAWVANPFVSANPFGLTRGFERVVQTLDNPPKTNINDLPADAADITRSVVPWLERNRDRRFFVYLHSLDLHAEYRPRPPFTRLFVPREERGDARPVDLYDTELAYNDNEIGRLISALKRLRLYDDTLVVVTADHGEEFGEHGFTRHGHSLFEALLHVPLVVKLPGSRSRGTRVGALASSLDVAPTLLDVAGIAAPAGFEGVSLRPALEGRPFPGRPVVFAEQLSGKEVLYAARDARYKAITQLLPTPAQVLFDLASDPGETHDLDSTPPEAARDVRARLAAFLELGQAGYHVALETSADAAWTIEATTPAAFADVQRFGMAAGESLVVSPDRTRATFAFRAGRTPRHFVLRTQPDDAPIALRATVDGRPLAADAVALGRDAAHPAAMPASIDAAAVSVTASEAATLLKQESPGLRVWRVAAPASRKPALDPELEQKLRALGYIQ